MRIITNKSQNLTGISTVVLYKWHPYLPPNIPEDQNFIEKILIDSSSSKILRISDNITSDFLDFVEYNFSFKVDKSKYKSCIKANYFDEKTRKKIGNDFEELKKISDYIIPQGSSDIKENSQDTDYFGIIQGDAGQSIIFLPAYGETWNWDNENSIEQKSNGIWKMEIYNTPLDKNYSEEILNGYSGFIEYDTLRKLRIKNIEAPIITIEFGPDFDIKNNTDDMYYSGVTYSTDSFTQLSIYDYSELLDELLNNKLLYLIVSSDGTIKDINLSYLCWNLSNNPNRNQNDYSLRNDDFWESRNMDLGFIGNYPNSKMIHDKNSHTLLGTKKLNLDKDCPLLLDKVLKAENKYTNNIVYNKNAEVDLENYTWKNLSEKIIGDNPVISKYWILSDYSFKSDYSNSIVSSGNLTFGSVYPDGIVSIRPDKTILLKIQPEKKYKFPLTTDFIGEKTPYILKNNESFLFKDIRFEGDTLLRLYNINDQDNIKIIFEELLLRYIFRGYVKKDWVNNDSGSDNYYKNPPCPRDVQLNVFIDGVEKVDELQDSELNISLSNKLMMKIDTTKSLYNFLNISIGTDILSESEDGFIHFLDLSNPTTNFDINFECKTYNCRIVFNEGAEIEKEGEVLQYNQNFNVKFYPKFDYTYPENIQDVVEVRYEKNNEIYNSPENIFIDTSELEINGQLQLVLKNVRDNFKIYLNLIKNENK